jgi:ACS family D-galactonate transporter-like MFS transporter
VLNDVAADPLAAATSTTRTRARVFILGLVNYLDRTVLSVAAPFLSKDLGLDAAVMGLVFSSFSWTYAAAQIPGGVFLDRFGARLTYFLSLTVWSLFTLMQGFAFNLASLLTFRFGLGVAEAPCYPCNSRILSIWFPQAERARATGVYSVGQYFGLAFLSPLLFWVVTAFGWRSLLYGVGLFGIAFGLCWWLLYRDPYDTPRVNQAELDYIEAGGGLGYQGARAPFDVRAIGKLIRTRQILGASIGQFCSNSTLVFFLTWFPTYLATERHMGWLKVGFFTIMPFIAASVGVVAGGFLSDILLKRTGSANIGRKLPVVGGLLLASTIVAANFVNNDALVIAIMSLAFFGQGMCNLGWTLIADVAPKKMIGLTGGVFNLCANLAGIITPLVIGLIVARTGSFFYALAYIAMVALAGVASYVLILGDVKRVEID